VARAALRGQIHAHRVMHDVRCQWHDIKQRCTRKRAASTNHVPCVTPTLLASSHFIDTKHMIRSK
jgi:hypothetical protein